MNFLAVVYSCFLGIVMAAPNSNSNSPAQVEFRNRDLTLKKLLFTFEAFTPRGLKLSVSNAEGIDLFAFDGKINLPIARADAGSLTWQIIRPAEDNLVMEFPDSQLLTGDVINYWARIQYNGVSLYAENLKHIVRELTPAPFPLPQPSNEYHQTTNYQQTNYRPTTSTSNRRTENTNSFTDTQPPLINARPLPANAQSNKRGHSCTCNENALKDIWTQMNITAVKMRTLEENISPLDDKISSLTETIDELIKTLEIGTKLLLTGNLPVRTNPVEDVRHLLIEKLKLQDLSTTILQAEYVKKGIAFEVASSIDKLRILKRSKDILNNLSYSIEDPEKKPDIDVRNWE